jgi:hypothetical protein
MLLRGKVGSGRSEIVEHAIHHLFSNSNNKDYPRSSSNFESASNVSLCSLRPGTLMSNGRENSDMYLAHILNQACVISLHIPVVILLNDIDILFADSFTEGAAAAENAISMVRHI